MQGGARLAVGRTQLTDVNGFDGAGWSAQQKAEPLPIGVVGSCGLAAGQTSKAVGDPVPVLDPRRLQRSDRIESRRCSGAQQG